MILQDTAELIDPPLRIISLVPSQTELLYSLGLDEEIIGITKFCIHPAKWFSSKQKIGGTKNTDLEKINTLQPALIIANKEENVKEQVESLAKDFNVWVTEVNCIADALKMIMDIGILTRRAEKAKALVASIQDAFTSIKPPATLRKAAYLVWKKPYLSIGGDTFINDMLLQAGCKNIFQNKLRYPEITIEDILNSGCEYLFLSSEPYPFSQKHIDELQPYLPQVKIRLVDGEMFSWYGTRMLSAAAYFNKLQQNL